MISKTIGYNGVHNIFRQTHMGIHSNTIQDFATRMGRNIWCVRIHVDQAQSQSQQTSEAITGRFFWGTGPKGKSQKLTSILKKTKKG